MTVLLFIIVLVALILVHEFGHFIVAKWSGMRVDEFGVGFPPRLWSRRIGETEYSVNLLPLGGFVRIYGEDETEVDTLANPRAFSSRPRILQAATLVAGVAMNWLLAFLILTSLLIAGTPRALTDDEIAIAPDARLVVAAVMPGTPAADAGLAVGDRILGIETAGNSFMSANPSAFISYVSEQSAGEPLTVSIDRAGEISQVQVSPETGVIEEDPERVAFGVSVAPVGTVPVPLADAPVEGFLLTWEVTKQTAVGLFGFLGKAITLDADLSQVAGPVGIAGAVGDAYAEGFTQLLSIAAIISINLAIINLLPIPALDGGRLLFVGIEGLTRRSINPAVAATVNGVGFAALILLMLVITASDILKLI